MKRVSKTSHKPASKVENPNGPSGERIDNYEVRLSNDARWALNEGGRHFSEKSDVFVALHRIAQRLSDLGIPYAVIGGMALFRHGFRRFTEDVDILVTKEDLKKIHSSLEGLGYLRPHKNSKHLRDTELGVRIEFLTTGDYPGDGKVKAVEFPRPETVSDVIDGIRYVNLVTLIELKLASGMTGADRLKDLADVQELIKLLNLPMELATRLNPYVQEKYRELWLSGRRRFVILWRNKWLTAHTKSIEEMADALRKGAQLLEDMFHDGVWLEDDGGIGDDLAHLVTTDPEIAKKYDMIDESEFWGEEISPDNSDGD
jgi:hypothetical protein